jgi:hypothetical protein
MRRQRGRGDRGTKDSDRVLRKPGIFRKTRKTSSFLKRFHLISDRLKGSVLLAMLFN